MHELQTRAEHSRSLEDAPHFQAIETLTELGLLIPVAELETYHGRVGVAGDPEWKVDPSFQNGGSDGANTNVNKVPTLYTGEEQLAQDFANARIPSVVKTMYWDTFRQQVRGYTPKEKMPPLQEKSQISKSDMQNKGLITTICAVRATKI